MGCAGGTEAYEDIGPGEPYSIDLTSGSWKLGAYYRPLTNATVFVGSAVAITARARHTLKVNLSIRYQGL